MNRISQRDGRLVSVNSIDKSQIAALAQKEYDIWDQSDEVNGDPELGFGGICDMVADEIAGYLASIGVEDYQTTYSEYDTHTSVVAAFTEGVFNVDIPPSVYESGYGYNWKKNKDVKIAPKDVVVYRLDPNPNNFNQYVEV